MVIGVTGGIGSGKSTITRELAHRGYAVYDCDREAKRIIAENKNVQAQIIALLGADSFFSNGIYNTSYVAGCVFANMELRSRLNAIIHPAVFRDIQDRLNNYNQGNELFFIESAILFEAGLDRLCERIIIVEAPENTRVQRVIDRDYNGEASLRNINKVRARIRSQHTTPSCSNPIFVNNDGKMSIIKLTDVILHSLR